MKGTTETARRLATGAAVLTMFVATAAWSGPAQDRYGDASAETPPDCPGRQHPDAEAQDGAATAEFGVPLEAPPYKRLRIPPYGTVWGLPEFPRGAPAPPVPPPADYRAQVFHVVDCPPEPDGDRFPGLDDLIALMGHEGLKFHRSPTATLESGPEGIVAADDLVLIKINYQWPERGGTNMDVLRGFIRRIVDHPDTFTGEIAVCENAQFASTQGFNRALNNAEDTSSSPFDVVAAFQAEGVAISLVDWTTMRGTQVQEYADGDLANGYVVEAYDAQITGRVSYPKFRTVSGAYVSLRHGIWDTGTGTYDRGRLTFINVPVLKSHHAVYGVTACVKNYMGVVTGLLSTNSHNAIANGLLGAVLAEIQPADLNILDCIWVNANPFTGPSTTYAGAMRRNELVASVDPVAADIWAAEHILIPAFVANGYSPPWPSPSADPGDPTSAFRNYLDNSMERLLAAGHSVTNDSAAIDAFTWSGGGDLDGDGTPDALDNCPYDANPEQEDCDEDGVGDRCAILEGLELDCNGDEVPDGCDVAAGTSTDWNANGLPDECECLADVDDSDAVDILDLVDVIVAWGPCASCPEDLNGDGSVDVTDLVGVVVGWGPVQPVTTFSVGSAAAPRHPRPTCT